MERLVVMVLGWYMVVMCLCGAQGEKWRYVGRGLELELLPSHVMAAPGETVTYGLAIKHEEGYHTYWKSPGIIGYPMTLEWQTAEGTGPVEALQPLVEYPYPERVMMSIHPCYGYERDVVILSSFEVPADYAAAEVKLELLVRWLCCAEDCCPDEHRFSVSVPVGERAIAAPQRPRLVQAQAEIPLGHPLMEARMESEVDADPLVLEFMVPREIKPLHVFSEDNQTSSGVEQVFTPVVETAEAVTYRVELPRYEFSPKGATQAGFVLESSRGYWHLLADYPEAGE